MKRPAAVPALAWPILLLLLAAAGCSTLNGTRLEPLLGADVNLVRLGDRVAESLLTQAVPPLLPRQPDQPVLITTLVNNDQLAETSSFGRSFQNNLAAGFVSRGYAVREVKLRRDLLVREEKGEFMLTRDLQEMAGSQRAQAIVLGTYTLANRAMYLSVRLVDPADQTIRAAYEDRLTLDAISLRLEGLQVDDNDGCGPSGPVPPSPPCSTGSSTEIRLFLPGPGRAHEPWPAMSRIRDRFLLVRPMAWMACTAISSMDRPSTLRVLMLWRRNRFLACCNSRVQLARLA